MNKNPEDILQDILKMPQEQRAFVADRIMESLDDDTDANIEMAWQKEIQKRIESKASFMSWEEVKKKL